MTQQPTVEISIQSGKDSSALRRSPRIPVNVPVTVRIRQGEGEQVFTGELINLSEGGAFIHGVFPIGLGQEVTVEVRIAPSQGKQELKSEVRWVRGTAQSGLGVQFMGMAPEKKNFISELLRRAVLGKKVAA